MKLGPLFLLLFCILFSGLTHGQIDTVSTFYDNKSPKEIYLTDNGVKNGLYQIFYESGKLWQFGDYSNGQMTNEWSVNNSHGVLIQDSYYIKNKLQGQQKYYYPNGNLKQLLCFKEGVLNGIAQLYSNQGYLTKGSLSETISFKDGLKDGRYIKFNEEADSVILGNFKSDLSSGVWRHYDENGILVKEEKYINDITQNSLYYFDSGELKKQTFALNDSTSIQFTYYQTGELKSKLDLLNSSANGDYVQWYKSGMKKIIGKFIENQKTGDWEYILENGTKKEVNNN